MQEKSQKPHSHDRAAMSRLLLRAGACYPTGIGANVAYPSSQSGSSAFFMSTLYLPSNVSQSVGYTSGESPFINYSTSSLGELACDPDTYITEVYGRAGLILDDLCFTCSPLGEQVCSFSVFPCLSRLVYFV